VRAELPSGMDQAVALNTRRTQRIPLAAFIDYLEEYLRLDAMYNRIVCPFGGRKTKRKGKSYDQRGA
jgi:hypothetical protein